MESQSAIKGLLSALLPKVIYLHFSLKRVEDYREHIEIHLEELPELYPASLKDCPDFVLNGFCNPLELQTFLMNGKPVYLKIYRRRWKEKSGSKSYWNNYDFHAEGVKATHEFASFLKESYGLTPDQYNSNSSGLMRGR